MDSLPELDNAEESHMEVVEMEDSGQEGEQGEYSQHNHVHSQCQPEQNTAHSGIASKNYGQRCPQVWPNGLECEQRCHTHAGQANQMQLPSPGLGM